MEWSPNVGLADGRGVASTLETLLSRFRAVEFADLCTLIEEIVLRERIVLTGRIERFPAGLRAVLQPFFNAGVFTAYGRSHPIATLQYDANRVRASARALSMGLTMASPEDAQYEVSRLLGAEEFCGGVSLPLLRNLQHFGLMQRPRFENYVWDLAGRYRTISEAAQRIRDDYQRLSGVPVMGIPPFAFEVFSRSKDIYDLPARTLEMRDELAKLRGLMTELEERLRSGKLSPADAFAIERSWHDRWDREIASTENMARLSFARTSLPLLQNGSQIVRAYGTSDPVPALEVVGKMIARLPAALGNMQLRPVHRPVANYMRATGDEVRGSVAKLFKEDLVRIDGDMRRLAHERGTPWRPPVQALPECA
jgi:hypothetical protein